MKQKLLSLVMVLCLMLTLVPTLALAEETGGTANVSTQEELAAALSNTAVTEITLTGNITMSEKWMPADIAVGRNLTIHGEGHTISNMVVTDCLLKANDPGQTGNDCDYYAGFIGRNQGTLNIENLTFENANVRIDPLSPKDENNTESKGSKGSSIVSVVVASNMGSAILKNVNVNNSYIQASTKAGILLGFNGKAEAQFEANHCAVTNSEVKLIADGWDSEAAFSGVIVGYVGADWADKVAITGIKLSGNTSVVDPSVKWEGYSTETEDIQDGYQITLAVNAAEPYDSWVLTCDTYAIGNSGDVPLFSAEVDGYMYSNVADAVAAAEADQTVTLLCDTEEDVVIPADKTVTLDLNGKTLTGSVTDQGKLTIQDSTVSGQPVVSSDYQSVTYKSGKIINTGTAVLVEKGGQLTVESGSIESTGNISVVVHGAVTYTDWGTPVESKATIKGGYMLSREYGVGVYGNGAQLDIEGGVIVAQDNAAVAGNGNRSESKNENFGGTITNITGGTMISHIKSNGYIACGVYHPQAGELNITGGTIYADNGVGVLVRNGKLSISENANIIATGTDTGWVGDSKIPAGNGVEISYEKGYNHNNDNNNDNTGYTREVSITGGRIAADDQSVFVRETTESLNPEKFISGGYFTSDPTAYLASGKVAVPSDKSGYNYMIADMAANVGTATKEPVVEAAPDVTMTEEDLNKVAQTEADGLTPKLNEVANEIAQNESVTAKAANALTEAGITPAEGEGVSIVVRSFLDIQVQNYAAEGEKILTLDITPKYELVATTAKKAADGSYDLKEDTDDKNAAVIPGTETILTDVTVPVTVKVPVPEGFLTSDDANKIFVKHVKSNGATYYYPAKLVMDGSNDSKVVAIEFTTTHGFSPFTIQQDERKGTIQFDTGIGAKEYTAANVGDTLPVPAVPTGKTFGGWTIDGQTYTTLTDGLLTKLSEAENTTLAAAAYFYTPSYGGATTYSVKLPGTLAGGTVKADRTNASSGTTVTLTVQPAEGYVLDTLTVTDKNGKELTLTNKGNGKYSFTMPASNVTVAASFKDTDAWESPFTDVKSGDWFYDGVAYAYQQGMMNGVSATSFDPYGTTTRGMIVTILYRLEGSPAVSGSAFNDVADGAYYADAVTWASKNGIVTGFGDGAFGPDQAITREQMAAILYRYAAMKGYAVTDRADLTGFADAGSVSDYAKEAMAWANAAGLITGVTSTTLDPQGGAQRCQAAVILARFCQSIVK